MLEESAELAAKLMLQAREPFSEHLEEWIALMESSRSAIARFIGASAEEVALVSGTSMALSLIAGTIAWQPGDRVLFPSDEFPSNRFVWQNLQHLGVKAEAIAPQKSLEFADQLESIDLTHVRLVAFSGVSFSDGRRQDIERISRWCHSKGILVAVDGVQMAGAVPVKVHEWGCDYFACGGQKWLLGPVGSGFLYVARNRINKSRVPWVGWMSSRELGTFEKVDLEFCEGARRFEPGLPDIPAIAALGKSVERLEEAGIEAIASEVKAHHDFITLSLAERGIQPYLAGKSAGYSGIVSVEFPSEKGAVEIYERCHRKKIILTLRGRTLRMAAHAATNKEDIEAALEVVSGGSRAGLTISGKAIVSCDKKAVTGPEENPLAIVTGASRGLGEAIATELAERGFDLILMGRDRHALEELSHRLNKNHCSIASLDLSDSEVRNWISQNGDVLKKCHFLVNNAAMGRAALFTDEDEALTDAIFRVNVLSPLAITRAVLPGMIRRGEGHILNVASSGGRCATPVFSAYAASKGALWSWSESLSRELAGSGVSVTTFVPPHMATVTQRQLGRRSLAYYRQATSQSAERSISKIAKAAVEDALEGQPLSISWSNRARQAFNAASPKLYARFFLGNYRGFIRRRAPEQAPQ